MARGLAPRPAPGAGSGFPAAAPDVVGNTLREELGKTSKAWQHRQSTFQ